MSVFVSIEDKEGEGLAPVLDVDRIQRRFAAAADTLCLRFIGDAEDASFNRLQLPILVKELEAVLPGGLKRGKVLRDYAWVKEILGPEGASERVASDMVEALRKPHHR